MYLASEPHLDLEAKVKRVKLFIDKYRKKTLMLKGTLSRDFATSFASVVANGVNDTGGKIVTGVNDVGGKLPPV